MKYNGILVVIVLSLCSINLYATQFDLLDDRGTADGSSFLNYPIGSRAIGMGGAFTAVADDASAFYHNPAKLADLTVSFLSLHGQVLPNEGYLGGATFSSAPGEGSSIGWALSGLFLTREPLSKRDSTGAVTGKLRPYDGAMYFSMGFANAARSFFIGANLKGLMHNLDDKSGFGGGLDLAVLVRSVVDVGLMLQDAATVVSYQDREQLIQLDRILKLGVAFAIPDNPFKVAVQFDKNLGNRESIKFHLGAFFRIWESTSEMDRISAAIGDNPQGEMDGLVGNRPQKLDSDELYINFGINNDTLAMGFTLKIFGMGLDYALEIPNDFKQSLTHAVSVNFFL